MITPFNLPDNGIPIKVGDSSFIYKDVFHPIVWYSGEPYRPRVETLVLDPTGCLIFLRIKDDKINYRIPGGSIDNDSSYEQQAENETNEEAFIAVRDLKFSNVIYHQVLDKDYLKKGGDMCIAYRGSSNHVYVAYKSGEIDPKEIQEKDLDEDMVKNGKFYPIPEVIDILSIYHIEALLNSNMVGKILIPKLYERFNSMQLNNNRKPIFEMGDNLGMMGEMSYIYHGSKYKIDSFRPMSLDLGNGIQAPGWSTFCFRNHTLALRFGIMRLIQFYLDGKSKKGEYDFCGWDILANKPYLHEDILDEVCDALRNETCYVYTINSDNLDLGIGNDARFPEVTFRESGVIPEKREAINTSRDIIKSHVKVISTNPRKFEKEQLDHVDKINRGWVTCMLNRDYSTDSAVSKLTKAVSDGKLKPGDDVSKYIEDNNIQLDDVSFIERISNIESPDNGEGSSPTTTNKHPMGEYPLDITGIPVLLSKEPLSSKLVPATYMNQDDVEKDINIPTIIFYNSIKSWVHHKEDKDSLNGGIYYVYTSYGNNGAVATPGDDDVDTINVTNPVVINLVGQVMFYEMDGNIVWDWLSDTATVSFKPDGACCESFNTYKEFEEEIYLGDSKMLLSTTEYFDKESHPNVRFEDCLPKDSEIPMDSKCEYRRYLYLIEPSGNLTLVAMADFTTFVSNAEIFGILRIYVLKQYRRKGIGTVMANYLTRHVSNTIPMRIAAEMYESLYAVDSIKRWVERFGLSCAGNDATHVFLKSESCSLIEYIPHIKIVTEADGDEDKSSPDIDDEGAQDYSEDAEKSIDKDNNKGDKQDNAENQGNPDDLNKGMGNTDYTDDADVFTSDNTEDTSQQNDDSSDSGDNDESKNQTTNNEIKNYTILRDFEILYRLANEISDSLEPIIMEKPIQNKILTQVRENLLAVKAAIIDFMTLHYNQTNYGFNLYYYEVFLSALKKNIEIIDKNKRLSTNFKKNKNKPKE